MLININPETGRLHEKIRNKIQIIVITEIMKREGISDEMVCYERYGKKMTDVLNDKSLNDKIEEMAAADPANGLRKVADFIISLISESDYAERISDAA